MNSAEAILTALQDKYPENACWIKHFTEDEKWVDAMNPVTPGSRPIIWVEFENAVPGRNAYVCVDPDMMALFGFGEIDLDAVLGAVDDSITKFKNTREADQ